MAIGHEDARHQLVLGVSAGAVTNKTLLFEQLLVEKERVVPNECFAELPSAFLPLPPRPGLMSDTLDDGGDGLSDADAQP
jgi:hypothetical protein